MADIWTFNDAPDFPTAQPGEVENITGSLAGYEVEATDGAIGRIDVASTAVGRAYMVVDTGHWIFGKQRLVPAGVVKQVSHEARRVFVSCSMQQIKDAPDYSGVDSVDDAHWRRVGDHYSSMP